MPSQMQLERFRSCSLPARWVLHKVGRLRWWANRILSGWPAVFLSTSPFPNKPTSSRQQPQPTQQGHLSVLRELLSDGGRRACLRSVSKDGFTALHLAAATGKADAAQMLLDAGAKLDARDRVGHSLGMA